MGARQGLEQGVIDPLPGQCGDRFGDDCFATATNRSATLSSRRAISIRAAARVLYAWDAAPFARYFVNTIMLVIFFLAALQQVSPDLYEANGAATSPRSPASMVDESLQTVST
jgi:hypothetical protein